MADFIPSEKTKNSFNNGVKYNVGDGLQPETINNLIEGLLYAQENAYRRAKILISTAGIWKGDNTTSDFECTVNTVLTKKEIEGLTDIEAFINFLMKANAFDESSGIDYHGYDFSKEKNIGGIVYYDETEQFLHFTVVKENESIEVSKYTGGEINVIIY